jgi:hypothetical protein
MFRSTSSPVPRAIRCVLAVMTACLLASCAVVTVAGAAASVAATGVGLAADVAVGTVRLTGKAVGAVLPGSSD